MLLSIIVPIYNAEKYLQDCMNSLCKIGMKDVEFICVDDGSTDRSSEIVSLFRERDSRFVIINKENTGYGNSMNVGLQAAKGDYIGILESDDQFVEGAIEELVYKALSTDADVVKGNYFLFDGAINEGKLFENMIDLPYDKCINSTECENLFLTAPAIWSGIYRRKLIEEEKISFLNTPGAAYQDTSFAFKIWATAKRVVLVHNPVVFYRIDNEQSSSNSDGKVFEIFKEAEEMNCFLIDHGLRQFAPICMAAKFRSYKWTLDRLNAKDKIRFITRMHEDARQDCLSGCFQKKYWRDYDWMIMNNVLFNLSGYCREIEEGKEPRFRNEVIYDSLKDIPLYIISASREGEVMLAELWNYGMDICGYINHQKITDMPSISAPVTEIEAIGNNSMILISSLEEQIDYLISLLRRNRVDNYIVI